MDLLPFEFKRQMSSAIAQAQDYVVDNGYYTDYALRQIIRKMLYFRSKELDLSPLMMLDAKTDYVTDAKDRKITEVPEKANEQHYMIPPAFFEKCLGSWLKYSCCYYGDSNVKNNKSTSIVDENISLTEAEENMLEIYCERAGIQEGMTILDLGCGWGSFSLYVAQKYPESNITAVSNSSEQKQFIQRRVENMGISNLTVVTCDIAKFDESYGKSHINKYDRIVSIEMFEHCKNWAALLKQLSTYLKQSSKLGTPSIFIQTFCHKNLPYHFDDESWMSRNFFTGGVMPSQDLINFMGLKVHQRWLVNGKQYAKTSKDWLRNCDEHRSEILQIFGKKFNSKSDAWKHYNRWRVFYLAIEETFQYNNGEDWMVGHYKLTK
eukprot:NODE_193_length_13314_cov_0.305638.p5 type:complete len:378 gc:universal NODE_193_length_13314_cov_0.305638:6884-5751(-)